MTPRSNDKSRPGAITRLAAMPWGTRTALAALVAAAIAGCGSSDDKSIPPDASDQLIAQLNQVEEQVDAGQCELAQGGATVFQTKVGDLPSSVDSDTKKDLSTLADKLVELANNQCGVATGATGETGATTSPTESSTTESSTEATTSTSTTTSTTSTTEPEEEQPAGEPSQGGGSEGSQGQDTGGGNALGTGAGGSGSGGVKPKGGE
jgi:hypothetical protein